jgi:anhydro-N-acetylmuramic acid kinase
MLRAVGLMSGTSLDGVDAALIETDGHTVSRLGPALTLPYDPALRTDLRRLLDRAPTLAEDDPALRDATRRLTERHAEAVAALGEPCDIIGFHGQTILHQPHHGRTWQIGDAAWLARATGTQVAHDFRSADVAAGGEGAPLAPIFHAVMAANLEKPLAVLNIGGVSNVTLIGEDTLVACDCGPGNGPLDDWAQRRTGFSYDKDGALAFAGQAAPDVLARLMDHAFFARTGPKSLDRLNFNRALAESGLEDLSPADGAATLVEFVAAAIAGTALPLTPSRWLATGGGRRNPSIMRALRRLLGVPVDAVETVGWDGDALEAQCFALLAVRTLHRLPLSFPGTTGVPVPLWGGRLISA